MLQYILNYLSGYLRIRVEGYSPERFLNLCCYHRIYLWDLKPVQNAYEMNIYIRDFRRLRPIIRKSRTKVRIKEKKGLPVFLHKYRKRKLFFAGAFWAVIFIYILSAFIWKIQIDGNQVRTEEAILSFLEEEGVRYGMAKRKIDCDRIEKDIRLHYDDIIWVSAYIHGSCLKIRVKENPDRKDLDTKKQVDTPVDLVAEKDGRILSIVTRKGAPLVKEESEVKKGEILVSGSVEVKNDSGEVIGYQYYLADADIVAQTEMEYTNVLKATHTLWNETGRKTWRFWIETPEKLYLVGRRKLPYQQYTQLTEENRFYLEKHFSFPIFIRTEIIKECKEKRISYTDKEARELLSYDFNLFCDRLKKKGVQILENDVKIYKETNQYVAKGTLLLSEPFGILKEGEIPDLPLMEEETIQQEGN